jgi:hypothetical protein
LWVGYYDDESSRWKYYPYAYGPRKKVDPRTAAMYLLIEGWRAEPKYDSDPGPFHAIGLEGLLNSAELNAMKQLVWDGRAEEKPKKLGDFPSIADAISDYVFEKILEEGKDVAWQEWDSGSPGAGAGKVSIRNYKGNFYVVNDAGISGPYSSKKDALNKSGVQVVNESTVVIWDADGGYLYRRRR